MLRRTASATTTFLGFSGRAMVEVQEGGVLLEPGSISLEYLGSDVLALISGGAGGDVNIPDGADIAQGSMADAAWDEVAASTTIVAILKRAVARLSSIVTSTASVDTKSSSIVTNTGTINTSNTTIATNTGNINTSNTTIATNTGNINTSNTTIATNTGTAATGIGGVGDSPWISGNGSLIALGKAIAAATSTLGGAIASGRMNSNIQRTGSTTSVAIANAATDSAAIDIAAMITGGFIIPSAFTGTSVSYKVSYTTSGHQPLYDQFGNQVTTPVAVNRAFPFPAEAAGFASLIIVSSGAEGASRTLQLYRKG